MASFRETIGDMWSSLSASHLAQQIGMQQPVSLRSLMASYAIERKYQEIRGFDVGPLGHKRSGVFQQGNFYLQNYSAGVIQHALTTGSTEAIVRYQTNVSYLGFHCYQRQSDSVLYPANEPYFIVSVYPRSKPTGATTYLTRTYKDIDSGEGETDVIGFYQGGLTEDMVISVVGMEHDEGNSEEFKTKVCEVIQIVGSALSGEDFSRVPVWLDRSIGLLSEGIHRIFGMGDDSIGMNALSLTYEHLQQIADPYTPKQVALALTGHGAHYDVYFEYSTEIIERRI